MRILFLLLALLNLGYFIWQWQQPGEVKPAPSGPIAVAPGTQTLTLLSEIHAAPAANTTPPRSNSLQETPPASAPAPTP